VFHDPGHRVVTVERWNSAYGIAEAWAVYSDKVVCFTRNDFEKPERVLAEYPLDVAGLAEIRNAIEHLPSSVKGKSYRRTGVFDGTFYRFSFSPNGALTRDRIEAENIYVSELAPLLKAIDARLPEDKKTGYQVTFGSLSNDSNTKVTPVR
jgi:hypothetical protein